MSSGLLLLAGCATHPAINSSEKPVEEVTEKSGNILVEDIIAADAEIEPEPHAAVPVEVNASVKKWIEYFTVNDRERFRRFLEHGLFYKSVVQDILTESGVPKELYYLAMIESGYVPYARSRQNAVGAWQFMRGTGAQYGLKANRFDLDERRDVIRSTKAAAHYLKNLYREFGSWYLALASYNAGPGRIRHAVKKSKSKDFWMMVQQRRLPRETMNYVPKFLAAVIIGGHPDKFGFKDLKSDRFPEYAKARLPARVNLKEVAAKADMDFELLKKMNPHLLYASTPQAANHYDVWIPKDRLELVDRPISWKRTLISDGFPKRRLAFTPSAPQGFHRVKKGETLLSISQRYQIPVLKLKKINGLRSDRIYFGQNLRLMLANRT